MSQFPFPQQAPQPGFPQQAPQPGFPQQGFPQQAPAPAGPVPAQGSLDAFNSQPTGGRATGLTWANVQPNTPEATFVGTVLADVTDRDVQQDSDPQTKQLKFYRDGRPMFHMAVSLQLTGQYDQNRYPGGQATMYVRGRLNDALSDGMRAAGVNGAPKEGDQLAVTLTERRAGRGSIPANIYAVQYAPGPKWGQQAPSASAEAPAAAPAPVTPPAPQQAPSASAEAPGQQFTAPTLTPEQQALLGRLTGGTQ